MSITERYIAKFTKYPSEKQKHLSNIHVSIIYCLLQYHFVSSPHDSWVYIWASEDILSSRAPVHIWLYSLFTCSPESSPRDLNKLRGQRFFWPNQNCVCKSEYGGLLYSRNWDFTKLLIGIIPAVVLFSIRSLPIYTQRENSEGISIEEKKTKKLLVFLCLHSLYLKKP